MVFKNEVKNIQAEAYNGAHTVSVILTKLRYKHCQTEFKWQKLSHLQMSIFATIEKITSGATFLWPRVTFVLSSLMTKKQEGHNLNHVHCSNNSARSSLMFST